MITKRLPLMLLSILLGLSSLHPQAFAENYRIVTQPDYGRAEILDVYVNGKPTANQAKTENALYHINLKKGQHSLEVIRQLDDTYEYHGKITLKIPLEEHMGDIFVPLKKRRIKKATTATKTTKVESKVSDNKKAQEAIQSTPKPKKIVLPKMVKIPTGTFAMGCQQQAHCTRDELPTRTLKVKAFQMSSTEVTFEQWDSCYAANVCRDIREDQGWGRKQQPVINVSWSDAKKYTRWLSKKTGKHYRLPTEIEWEYAARANSTHLFSGSDCLSTKEANFNGKLNDSLSQRCNTKKQKYRRKPIKVGSFPANAFGLHDMHGNVWEWVEDCWTPSYTDKAPKKCKVRVLRGGTWHSPLHNLRSSHRFHHQQNAKSSDIGFRVVVD